MRAARVLGVHESADSSAIPSGLGLPNNDFNGDGTSDIFQWDTNSGALRAWLISNGQIFQAPVLGNVASNRQIVGAGDFNGDGTSDLLWRDDTGLFGEWLMSNGQIYQPPSSATSQATGASSASAISMGMARMTFSGGTAQA